MIDFEAGQTWKMFYSVRNVNNATIEIREVVDGLYIVYKTKKGKYKMERISYLELLQKQKILTFIHK